jgi:ribosomal protein S18
MTEQKFQNSSLVVCPGERSRAFIPGCEQELRHEEVSEACAELLVRENPLFRKIDNKFRDPKIVGQEYALFSFLPAIGASPNKFGVFGYAKVRGNFATEEEAQQHAIGLIQKVDSTHSILTTTVGCPFPLALNNKTQLETNEVNLNKDAQDAFEKMHKKETEEERQNKKEVLERKKQLEKSVDDDEISAVDQYITERVKIAHGVFRIIEMRKDIELIKRRILETNKILETAETEFPEILDQFKDKFNEVSKSTGVDKADDEMAKLIRTFVFEKPNFEEVFETNKA